MEINKIHEDDRRKISLLSGLIDKDREFTIIHLKKGKAIGGCVHQEVEHMCLIDGSMFVTIGSVHESLIAGDAREIGPMAPHMFHAKEDCIILEWGVKPEDKGEHDAEMRSEVNEINEG